MDLVSSLAAFFAELPGAILSLCPSKDFPDEPRKVSASLVEVA